MDVTRTVKRAARGARAEPRDWAERLARFGYAAKGVVYVVVGFLATAAALKLGGGAVGTRGALETMLGRSHGALLLGTVAVGLAGFALWRFLQAFADADRKGTDAKGVGIRFFYGCSGIVYGSLAFAAVKMALGRDGGGRGDSYTDWTAELMSKPFGRWLVAIAGVVILGVAAYQGYRAYTAKFRKRLRTGEMNEQEDAWSTRIGRFGFASRGVVFALIGTFLIAAAMRTDPGEARGLEGALEALAAQPLGPGLLGIVGAGLTAYGLFQIFMARYRDIVID